MKRCPKCGKQFKDDSMFCDYCGTELQSIEVTPKAKQAKQYDIEMLEMQLELLKAKKLKMFISGLVMLTLGLTALIISIFVILSIRVDTYEFERLLLLYVFGFGCGAILTQAGVILLIVQAAVFPKKISNRERIIRESKYSNNNR